MVVAALYKEKLALLFDKQGFKGQQRDWQQVLRTHCAKRNAIPPQWSRTTPSSATRCAASTELWRTSYKTADVEQLAITHVDARQFDFTLNRDLDGETLCKLPASDGEAEARSPASPRRTRRTGVPERASFTLERDKTGHVTEIAAVASAGCKRYCKANHVLGRATISPRPTTGSPAISECRR